MSVAVGISVVGADQLRSALRQMGDAGLKRELAQANKAGAEIVVKAALPNVPRGKTGRLRGSVRALGSQRSGRAVAGKASVKYAGAIHWGRQRGNVGRPPGNHKGPNRIAARPFLRDAAQSHQLQIVRVYEQAIDQLTRRALGGR